MKKIDSPEFSGRSGGRRICEYKARSGRFASGKAGSLFCTMYKKKAAPSERELPKTATKPVQNVFGKACERYPIRLRRLQCLFSQTDRTIGLSESTVRLLSSVLRPQDPSSKNGLTPRPQKSERTKPWNRQLSYRAKPPLSRPEGCRQGMRFRNNDFAQNETRVSVTYTLMKAGKSLR